LCDGIPIKDIEVLQPNRILKGYHKHDPVIIKINQDQKSLEREVKIMQSFGRDPLHAVLYLDHHDHHLPLSSSSIITKYFSQPLNYFFVQALDSVQIHQANQILSAVDWLHHKQKVIHCDLKPENILVLDQGGGRVEVKLCDFDSARFISEPILCISPNDQQTPLKFTPSWVCPEIFYYSNGIDISGNQTTDPLVATVEMDLFSLGLVLACVLSQRRSPEMTILPSSLSAIRISFDTRSYLQLIPRDLIPGCYHIIEKLWSYQPSRRGSITEIITLINDQRRTIISQQLNQETKWREQNITQFDSKILNLQLLINELVEEKQSSSPKLTELFSDVCQYMTSHMEAHYTNYVENIKDLKNDVMKGQRLLEALQDHP
jgi:serine/threonine protein kinase